MLESSNQGIFSLELVHLKGMFEGAEPKSRKLSEHFRRVAEEYGCEFLDTLEVIISSEIDAIHLELSEHRKLGRAVADKVRRILGSGDCFASLTMTRGR